jgi:hypothetical protein
MDLLRARQSEYIHPFIVTFDASGFLRTDQWRYIEWLDRGTQALFRIEDDPLERDNLADQFPEVVAEFAARTEAWREALNQPAAWMDLTGRLATEDRMPASGLRLWLKGIDQSGASRRLEVFSNPRGFFRFPNVPAGDYTLTYEIEAPEIIGRWRRSRRTTATQSMEIDLNGYETGPFLFMEVPGSAPPPTTLASRSGTLDIQLRDRRGAERAGVPVHVRGWTQSGFVRQRLLSGPDGFVVADQLPPGIYLVDARPQNGPRTRTRMVYLRSGAGQALDFTVKRKRHRHRHRRG